MLASLTVPFYVSPFPLLLVQLVSGTVVLPSFPLCAISFTGFHLLQCWFFLYHSWLLWTRIAFLWDRGRFPVPERRSFRPTSPAKTNKQNKPHTNKPNWWYSSCAGHFDALLSLFALCWVWAAQRDPSLLPGGSHTRWLSGWGSERTEHHLPPLGCWQCAGSARLKKTALVPTCCGQEGNEAEVGLAPPQGGLGPWLEATRGSGAAGLNRPKLLLGHHEAAEKFSVSWAMAC